VGYVNTHATGTLDGDVAEVAALRRVFGDRMPAFSSTKSMTGHGLGAAGALEAVAVLLAMSHRQVPPTAGLTDFDPELPAINVVREAPADWEPGPSLSNSFGFGGHNGTLVLGPGT
jgi:3-oxoacyl-[acyl-carrier-protein] synthase II